MAKRRNTGETGHGWFAQQWLDALDVKQADVVRALDWPKSKASELISGKQRYNQESLEQLADYLNLSPYELLLHPEDAMKIRQFRTTARQLAQVNLISDAMAKAMSSGDEEKPAPEAKPHKRKAG